MRFWAEAENEGAGKFVDLLVEVGGFDQSEALVVFGYYVKNRLVKFDRVSRSFNVKHGAYLDREVLARALTLGRKAGGAS